MENLPAVIQPDMRQGGLVASTFDSMLRMSNVLFDSGLMPKEFKNPAAVFLAIQMGCEIGLSPMQAIQNIAIINGRPTVWGDMALALVRNSKLLEKFSEEFTGVFPQENFTAICRVSRRGGNSIVRYFSVADAKRAGLWGKTGPWSQYPARMLQMRARAFALRDEFGDIIKGVQVAEEVRDIPSDHDLPVYEPPIQEVQAEAPPH